MTIRTLWCPLSSFPPVPQGGVSDEVSLTAYTTAALLELDAVSPSPQQTHTYTYVHVHTAELIPCPPVGPLQADPMVPRVLQCLRGAVEAGLENTYTMALLSYAFSLAGDQQTKTALLTALHNKSITDGICWSGPGPHPLHRTPQDHNAHKVRV